MPKATKYPEHEKLRAVAAVSQEIGGFLDVGLARMGLELYQRVEIACNCHACEHFSTTKSTRSGHLHSSTEVENARDGVVYYERWRPTHRSISSILAEYFGIDQDAIDREKEAMLAALRGGSGA